MEMEMVTQSVEKEAGPSPEINFDALGALMDGEDALISSDLLESDRRARQAEHELVEKNEQLMRAVDVLRFAQTTVADCVDLLDRRASTPEYNRELAHTALLALAKELARPGVPS